jgi:hypothetical protein
VVLNVLPPSTQVGGKLISPDQPGTISGSIVALSLVAAITIIAVTVLRKHK